MNYIEHLVKEATSSTTKEEQLDMILFLLKDAIRRIEILKQPVKNKIDDK